jgi:uncharacterized membrane protein YwzB
MDWGLPIVVVVIIIIVYFASKQVNFKKLFQRKKILLTDSQKEVERYLAEKIKWGQDLTPTEEIALLSLREIMDRLEGDTEYRNLIKGYNPKHRAKSISAFFPEEIPIISYEKNGTERRISFWTLESSNVVRDNSRGKAADLGEAKPVSLVAFGKAMIAFEVDGDRGVGVNVNLDTLLLSLTTTAEEAWSYLQSGKLAKIYTDNLIARQVLMYVVIGVIVGQLVFYFFHI